MSKNFDQFTKFSKKFDMSADGVEEDVVAFLKESHRLNLSLYNFLIC